MGDFSININAMAGLRISWVIGCFIVVNLFVLYYQSGGDNNSRNENKDRISAPLFFDQFDDTDQETKSTVGTKIWKAFDASGCVGQPFQVYVHNLSPLLKDSKAAKSLQSQLLKSPYSTQDLKKACIFVYLAHESEDLEKLPFWIRNGEGLLVIFPGGYIPQKYPNRLAFFVGQHAGTSKLDPKTSDLHQESKTSNLDLQIYANVPNVTLKAYQLLPKLYPFQKRQYIMNLMAAQPSKQVQKYFSSSLSKLYYVDFGCKAKSGSIEMGFCSDDGYRTKYLKDSVFTLLLPSMENLAQRFYEALLYGSIPIVIGDLKDCLPFAEFIDWKRAVLNFPPHYLGHLNEILPKIEVSELLDLRRNGRFYLENYLYDAKVLVRSILTFYRNRLGLIAPDEKTFKANVIFATHPDSYTPTQDPPKARTAFDLNENINYLWNVNPVYLDSTPLVPFKHSGPIISDMDLHVSGLKTMNRDKKLFRESLSGNYVDEKFTVVMVSYKRDEQVKYTLEMLNNTRFLDRVIVVWNDISRQVPDDIIPFISVPIFVVNASKNSLNNRFLPFDLIRTEAVFNMDDDFNTDLETIEFSFRVWRENRFAVVGPNFRFGNMDKDVGSYTASNFCQQNMILTSGAFLHRVYHYTYTNMLDIEILNHIDKLFNCEDIAVNFLVSHLARKPPVKTTSILNTSGKKASGGLSTRGNSHYTDRSNCIKVFVDVLGYNPLIASEYRADSVLYNHGNQCYKTT